MLSALYVINGTLGLVNTLLVSRPTAEAVIPLAALYGIIHPFLAYFVFSLTPGALKVARLSTALLLLLSFFLFPLLDQAILSLNAILYLYVLFYLFRHDVKTVFGE